MLAKGASESNIGNETAHHPLAWRFDESAPSHPPQDEALALRPRHEGELPYLIALRKALVDGIAGGAHGADRIPLSPLR